MSFQSEESLAVPAPDLRDAVENVKEPGPADEEFDAAAPAPAAEDDSADRMLEYLQEARGERAAEEDAVDTGLLTNGSVFRKFKNDQDAQDVDDAAPAPGAPDRSASSTGSYSTPDDTPSLRVCSYCLRGCL